MTDTGTPSMRLSRLGSGAVLLDAAAEAFSETTQRRIWSLASEVARIHGVGESVPGMNNLLVVFDPVTLAAEELDESLRGLWANVEPMPIQGRTVEVPVIYGGSEGEDLTGWAEHCGLSIEEAVHRHAASEYSVAAIGAMPGFPYMSGLDPSLARPRRSTPRAVVSGGAVIIGGAQAGIMPQTGPSGWHILGRTELKLFDPDSESPSLLRPGDSLRFVVAGVET